MKKVLALAVLLLAFAAAGLLFQRALEREPGEIAVQVYFTRLGEPALSLFARERVLTDPGGLEQRVGGVLKMLLLGPDAAEEEAGYHSELPAGVKLNRVAVENQVAYVDFSPEIAVGGGTASMRARLKQVVYTVTQFERVARVRFLIDGEMIDYFSGEGLTEVERPLGRDDFQMEEP